MRAGRDALPGNVHVPLPVLLLAACSTSAVLVNAAHRPGRKSCSAQLPPGDQGWSGMPGPGLEWNANFNEEGLAATLRANDTRGLSAPH